MSVSNTLWYWAKHFNLELMPGEIHFYTYHLNYTKTIWQAGKKRRSLYDQTHIQAYINNYHVGGLINAYTQQVRLTAAFCVPYVSKKHNHFMGETWKLCTIYCLNLHFTGLKKTRWRVSYSRTTKLRFFSGIFWCFTHPHKQTLRVLNVYL